MILQGCAHGDVCIAQPNMRCLRKLAVILWGKPGKVYLLPTLDLGECCTQDITVI